MSATVAARRLLLMIGLVVAAYFALTLLDHAARADDGLPDPTASVEKVIADAEKAKKVTVDAAKDRVAPKPKVERQKTTVKKRAVPTLKAEARRVPPAHVKAPTAQVKARHAQVAVPAVQVKAKVRNAPVAVSTAQVRVRTDVAKVPVRHGTSRVEALAGRALTAVPQLNVPPRLPVISKPPALPLLDTPPALPAAPSVPWLRLPAVPLSPQAVLPPSLQAVQPSSLPVGLPSSLQAGQPPSPAGWQPAPLLVPAPMATASFALPDISDMSTDVGQHASPRRDGGTVSSAPGAPRPPASPHPGDNLAGVQLRDAGGGAAPAMGTVPSSWRPEIEAAAITMPAHASASGRTVRYNGPPS
ncbi:hypothetical protein ACQPZX_13385 [Actinoplanes sp. CA-142083]|uniref:hypothetical protein n=1 Tax=Actinoplanes sp. CA-142083 TaxID=3239903 RepID=UPI003D9109B9